MEIPLPHDFQNIRASDEQEFYRLAADYFYLRRSEYSTGYHIMLFLKIAGVFQFTSYQYFEQEIEFTTFENELESHQFRVTFQPDGYNSLFFFRQLLLFVAERFNDERILVYYKFDQKLKDYLEKGIIDPAEYRGNVEEFFKEIIHLAAPSGSVDKAKKRLAS